jgi:hypothetical protein
MHLGDIGAGRVKPPSQTFTHGSARDLARPEGQIPSGSTGCDLQPGFDTPVGATPVGKAHPASASGVAELHEPHHRRLLVIESLGQRTRVLGGELQELLDAALGVVGERIDP